MKMLMLAKLRMAAMVVLTLGLVGPATGAVACAAVMKDRIEPQAQDANSAHGPLAATEKDGTVTATLKTSKTPAVFAAGEPVAFDVILKYTGDKPKMGFVEVNRFWTFLFTPVDGGTPLTAVLRIRRSKEPMAAGVGPNAPLAPLPLENGKERSRSFVLNQTSESSRYVFADARKPPNERKKELLSPLPPGKYSLTASHTRLPGDASSPTIGMTR